MSFRRLVITRRGGPEVLRIVEEATREPGPGEVRIRTLAAGVSFNLVPGYKRVKLYSIQMLKRRHPSWFREDLELLLGLLSNGRIRPLVAERFPLHEAARAQEMLAAGSTVGKLVLTFE